MARYGQITEVGYGGGFDQAGPWETSPGSAGAYSGTDDENSPGAGVMYPGRQAPKARRPGWAPETGAAGGMDTGEGLFGGDGGDFAGQEVVESPFDQTGPGGSDFFMDTMEADPDTVTAPSEYELTEDQAATVAAAAMAEGSEPCGLTIAELEAHKAQMAADADHMRRQKTIHLALAAAAGFILARYVLR